MSIKISSNVVYLINFLESNVFSHVGLLFCRLTEFGESFNSASLKRSILCETVSCNWWDVTHTSIDKYVVGFNREAFLFWELSSAVLLTYENQNVLLLLLFRFIELLKHKLQLYSWQEVPYRIWHEAWTNGFDRQQLHLYPKTLRTSNIIAPLRRSQRFSISNLTIESSLFNCRKTVQHSVV